MIDLLTVLLVLRLCEQYSAFNNEGLSIKSQNRLCSSAKTLKCGICSCQLLKTYNISFSVFELYTITHCHDVGSDSIPNSLAGLESLAFLHSQVIVMLLGECATWSKSHLLPPVNLSSVVMKEILSFKVPA